MTDVATPGMEHLFARDPMMRWEAAREFAPERSVRVIGSLKSGDAAGLKELEIDPLADLPESLRPSVAGWGAHFALYGAANAWLVFVGPSPGGSPTPDERVNSLLSSTPNHRNPTLGWPHPTFWYPDTRGFQNAIRRWSAETIVGVAPSLKDEEALSCSLVINLTHGRFGNANNVNAREMAAGASRFWTSVVPVARPRLIIALTRDVYQQLRASIPAGGGIDVLGPVILQFRSSAPRYTLPRSIFRHPSVPHSVLLATLPQHPSRRSFLGRDLSPLYRYLGQTAREARDLD